MWKTEELMVLTANMEKDRKIVNAKNIFIISCIVVFNIASVFIVMSD